MPEPFLPSTSVLLPVSGSFPARLVQRTTLAPGILDLRFDLEAPSGVVFEPGQFLTMLLSAPAPGGVPLKRSYSLASERSPADVLRFIVRLVPEGAASRELETMPLGKELIFTGPHGFFTLASQHAGDVVFGATGTGLAALFPMLAALATQPANGKRVVFWGVRHEQDLFARAEVEDACGRASTELRICLTAPPDGWTGLTGRITAPLLAMVPELVSPVFYLVGNGAMIASTKAELVARGVNRKTQIRTEAFFD